MGKQRRSERETILVVSEVGEILQQHIHTPSDLKLCFPGGYGCLGLQYTSRLRKADLPRHAKDLGLFYLESSSYSGLITIPNATIAAELNVSKTRVASLKGMLERFGFIYRIGPKTVFVNPVWLWRGDAKSQHEAILRWVQLHPVALVRSEEAA